MIRAITIDFWNTTVDSSNGRARRAERNDALEAVYRAVDRPWNIDEANTAFAVAYEEFERCWHGEQRTLTAAECLNVMWRHLDLDVPSALHADTVRRIEDSILAGMPELLPGAAEALQRLAEDHRLALISDTAFSPGRVLRKILEHHDVERHFTALVFSDEVGVSKPHPRMFATALAAVGAAPAESVHIGDIERTDIAGAKEQGMRAILYRGDETGRYFHENGPEGSAADAVAHSWEDVLSIINTWKGRS